MFRWLCLMRRIVIRDTNFRLATVAPNAFSAMAAPARAQPSSSQEVKSLRVSKKKSTSSGDWLQQGGQKELDRCCYD